MNRKRLFQSVLAGVIGFITTGTAVAADWTDNMKFKSDFRFRHEYIETEDVTPRHRQRLRARIAMNYKVSDQTKVGFRLASGSDDPVSTNQSLDGAFSTKTIGLDMAFVSWKPMDQLWITAGKQKNPFYKPGKSELIWDGDLTPEGLALGYNRGLGPVDLDLRLSGLWVDEISADDDLMLIGTQLALATSFMDEKVWVKVGGGFFGYENIRGATSVFDNADSFGNTVDGSNQYANGFRLTEISVEVGLKMLPLPVSIFYDSVSNSAASDNDTGYLVGLKIGKRKAPGSWDIRYNFREIKSDAVVGAFTDSDFKGGGTDGKGSEFGFGYQTGERSSLGFTFFLNENSLDSASKKDFYRGQLDFVYKL